MLPGVIILLQRVEHNLHVAFIARKIGIGSIDEYCFQIVLPDVAGIGILQVKKILVGYGLLVGALTSANVFLQFFDGCMQVDQYIWVQQLLVNDIEEFLIQAKLFRSQVDLCEQQAFGKKVIADRNAFKKVVGVQQVFQLFVALRHKKQLERKGILCRVLIKLWQEGIFGKFFENETCI